MRRNDREQNCDSTAIVIDSVIPIRISNPLYLRSAYSSAFVTTVISWRGNGVYAEMSLSIEVNEVKNELWAIYAWWGAVLIIQMMSLTWFTGRIRVNRKVIHSEEDRRYVQGSDVLLCPSGGGHPDVDHIRSAHRNDLKIILPFLIITPIWLTTSPPSTLAKTLLRCFPITRILHTLFYMKVVQVKPSIRMFFFLVGYAILVCMTTSFMIHYSG